MAKRRPEFELNHDNWDEELPAQEVGVFSVASSEEISGRVIRKAKRRLPEGESSMNKGVFANFSGFGKSSNGNLFSFLDSKAKTLDMNPKINFSAPPLESVGLKSASTPLIVNKNNLSSGNETKSGISNPNKPRAEYLQKLRKLNQDFVTWIQEHFNKNPYLDLTPVFKDYAVHLKNLEEKYQDNNKMASASTTIVIPTIDEKLTAVTQQKPLISTLISTNNEIISGEKSEQKEDTKPTNEDDEEPTYKTEVKVVDEENTQFKTRCKLFYKKDAIYTEKGVGTLYIKSIDNNKSSLLIRAETALGSILMNILLTSSIPTQRVGKNNVSLICIPNPPITSKNDDAKKPVSFLIRVKDAEMADELLKKLEDAKNH